MNNAARNPRPHRGAVEAQMAVAIEILTMAPIRISNLVRLEKYVKDMQAISHDYVLMGVDLKVDEDYAGGE